jgi:TM2 domain-containing membrane protein YozV
MPDRKTKFCSNCGKKIDFKAEICPKCGVRVVSAIKHKPASREIKNPGLAAVLSFLITGLGQIYNGQIGKGILMLILMIVFFFMILIIIGIPLLLVLWIYGIYDAYETARKINSGEIKI